MLGQKRKVSCILLVAIALIFSALFAVSITAYAADSGARENLCSNGDFEDEYAQWGVNGLTPERVLDEGTSSYVGKIETAGWLQTRLWNAGYAVGAAYKVGFDLKIESTTPNNDNQYLIRLKGNDGAWLPETYIGGFGEGGLIETGAWKNLSVYFSISDNKDETYTIKGGVDLSNPSLSVISSKSELQYLDVALGCGALGSTTAWKVDNVVIEKCGYAIENQLFDNWDFEKEFTSWGVNSYAATHERYLDEAINSYTAKQTGTGWLSNRIGGEAIAADKTYRVAFDMKIQSDAAVSDNQFLAHLKANDVEQYVYVDIGANNGTVTNVYRQYYYYFKLVEGDNGALTLYKGTKLSALTATDIVFEAGQTNYLDLQIGCGAIGACKGWYIDNCICEDVTPLPPAVTYDANITVTYENGDPADGFEYIIEGKRKNVSVADNVITVTEYSENLKYTITKKGYMAAIGNITLGETAASVVLSKREYTQDATNPYGNMFGYYGFENEKIDGQTTQLLNRNGWDLFINGNAAEVGLTVTDEDSYLGANSVRVKSSGDRLVTRIIGYAAKVHQSDTDTEYRQIMYVKAVGEEVKIKPCVVVGVFTADSHNLENGWGPDMTSGGISLGEEMTVTSYKWSKVEMSYMYRFEGTKIIVKSGTNILEYDVGKEIKGVGLFDVSLECKGEYYVDNIAFMKAYDFSINTIGEDNASITQGITYEFTDYMGDKITLPMEYADGVLKVSGGYGKLSVKATVGDKIYNGTVDAKNANLTFAEQYTATVKITNAEGEYIEPEDVSAVYAMDGATKINGVYDPEEKKYSFSGAMGELVISVLAKGAEQHQTITVSRTNKDADFIVVYIPDADSGLAGNIASNGNAEELKQIVMLNHTEYTYPGVPNTPVQGKWFSFGPIVSLSDEAAVGNKSVRISTSSARLAEDDDVYYKFLKENELAAAQFNDRLGYRSGNAYAVDGTEYSYTSYVKAPATETETTFQIIHLVTCNLNNYGQFNLWNDEELTVGNEKWQKIEMRFSFLIQEDASAAASGKYENKRYELVCKYKLIINDATRKECTGIYGYDVYSKGQYYFYMFDGKGGLTGAGEDTTHEDSVKDGGASFGSFASIEPSYQIMSSNSSLLIDGATLTSQYEGKVTVLKRDLSSDDKVSYLKLSDKYTGEITYLTASEYYDAENKIYRIGGLFHSYDITACDADKKEIDGLIGQVVSSEVSECTVEYEYDVKIKLVDQHGNAVIDAAVRIVLANGSTVNAKNNGDGTYTYEGLTGIRSVNFRKGENSENDYTFPAGVTVTSADCDKTVEVTKAEESSESVSATESKESDTKGCFGSMTLGMTVILSALAYMFIKRR